MNIVLCSARDCINRNCRHHIRNISMIDKTRLSLSNMYLKCESYKTVNGHDNRKNKG